MDSRINVACFARASAYVEDMLEKIKDSKGTIVLSNVANHKHYPATPEQKEAKDTKEVLVPAGFLNDVKEIMDSIIKLNPQQKEISDAGKEFLENGSRA